MSYVTLSTDKGTRMVGYYPYIIASVLEYQAIVDSEGVEFADKDDALDLLIDDAYILTMQEDRVAQWERELGITHSSEDTVDDRREVILARLRGSGKLNTTLINSIVGAFTNGGTAESSIENSVLVVKINPPVGNKQYRFINVEQELTRRVPAHIGINVSRNYSTWEEVRDNIASWSAINSLATWEDLKLYIAPQ